MFGKEIAQQTNWMLTSKKSAKRWDSYIEEPSESSAFPLDHCQETCQPEKQKYKHLSYRLCKTWFLHYHEKLNIP